MKVSEPNSPREAVDDFKRKLEAMKAEIKDIHGLPQEVPMGEPAAAKFKIGDVVVLHSGGPAMTVYFLPTAYGGSHQLVETEWFAGDELRRDAFTEAEIESMVKKPA